MKYLSLILISFFLLTACSSNQADFKSDVPSLNERIVYQVDDELPNEINLNIQFLSQAPDGDWGMPWQEACEEASITLAYYYSAGKDLTKENFKEEIQTLIDWQNDNYGDYEHTDINQTLEMLKSNYDLGVSNYEMLKDPTINDLKKELAKGNVIVAPFAGRLLNNPFYSGEGPLYHMMVLRGYDEENFITNDVGTRRGENFIYPYETIISAMHDWDDEDIELGEKKAIVLKKL